jgi:hypothetical protein
MAATTRSPTVKILRACHATWKKISAKGLPRLPSFFRLLVACLGFVLIGKLGDCYCRNESPIPKETT